MSWFRKSGGKAGLPKPFIDAICSGDVEEVTRAFDESSSDTKKLLRLYNVDKTRPPWEMGYTALHFAAHCNHPAIIDLLMQRGADANARTQGGEKAQQGRTPAYVAARNGSTEGLNRLIAHGADLTIARSDGWSIVHAAAGNGQDACLKKILEMSPDPAVTANLEATQQNKSGWRPLMQAAGHGHPTCTKILLDFGADVNAIRSDGATAIHWAAARGNEECINYLILAKADLSITFPKDHRYTCLHEAARGGHRGSVELIAKHLTPAQIQWQDGNGMTAAQLASVSGFPEIANILNELATGTVTPQEPDPVIGGADSVLKAMPLPTEYSVPMSPAPSDPAFLAAEEAPAVAVEYWSKRKLDNNGFVGHGFYDPGTTGTALPVLAEIQTGEVNEDRECLHVHADDIPLKSFAAEVGRTLGMLPGGQADLKIRMLGQLIAARLGGVREDLLERIVTEVLETKARLSSNVIPLGSLAFGSSRHRALLFKLLADENDIPCELHRSEYSTDLQDFAGAHAWNVVKKDGKDYIINLLDHPGALMEANSSDGKEYIEGGCLPSVSADTTDSSDNAMLIHAARSGSNSRAPNPSRRMVLPDFRNCRVLQKEYLGKGQFASVSRVSMEGFTVAQKAINISGATRAEIAKFQREIALMCQLKHENVVRCLGYDISRDTIYIYMEYVPCSLRSVIKSLRRGTHHGRFSPQDIHTIALGMAKGMLHLHSQHPPIIHRDLKSPNVLVEVRLDSSSKLIAVESPKICDLGIAKTLSDMSVVHDTFTGTVKWMPPETIALHPILPRPPNYVKVGAWSDVWSYGMCLYEIMSGCLPYEGMKEAETIQNIRDGIRPPWPAANHPNTFDRRLKPVVQLYEDCTKKDATRRPTAKQIVERLAVIQM